MWFVVKSQTNLFFVWDRIKLSKNLVIPHNVPEYSSFRCEVKWQQKFSNILLLLSNCSKVFWSATTAQIGMQMSSYQTWTWKENVLLPLFELMSLLWVLWQNASSSNVTLASQSNTQIRGTESSGKVLVIHMAWSKRKKVTSECSKNQYLMYILSKALKPVLCHHDKSFWAHCSNTLILNRQWWCRKSGSSKPMIHKSAGYCIRVNC